jgi:PAS domain S-box-containing protein
VADGSRKRIVVVEDESIVALDIKLQLETLGYDVPAVFDCGEDLLDELDTLQPDLIMMDVLLKGELDGIETANRVRARSYVPVILLTALDTPTTLERAKLAQPFAFIVKPFNEIDLRNTVVITLHRNEMERALRMRERLFGTTLESIQDGVFVTDADFRIEYWNSVAQAIIGGADATIEGRDVRELLVFHENGGEAVGLLDPAPGVLSISRSDGSSVMVERSVAPLVTEGGEGTGWVVVVRDITERVQQEERIRISQKMEAIGRLTGGIAHDFNNLLTVILGYAKLLGEELETPASGTAPDSAALRADVDGIRKAALRSAALTRQLLAFSRHQIMERRVVDVNTIVADMQKMIGRLVSDDVRMHVDLLAEHASVRVDPSQLEQVIMNLAVNARDAMPDGGRLAIRTDLRRVDRAGDGSGAGVTPGDFVAITVRDTGVGMSPSVLEKVYDPFFTTKPVGEGTGLGLSTVYGIVSQSGGFITADSTPGKGTTFVVHLPLHAGGGSEREESSSVAEAAAGTETVLLVEDDDAIRALLSRVLRKKGYVVLEASNAGEALLIHERTPDRIDILVSDVVMPHLSGIDLGTRLKELRPEMKTLFVSAYPQGYLTDSDRQKLGPYFMQKPVDPARFVERVRSILDE